MHSGTDTLRVQLPHHLGTLDRQMLLGKYHLEHVPVGVLEIGGGQPAVERAVPLLEVAPRQRLPSLRDRLQMGKLSQRNAGGNVGQVELAAQHIDFHAVFARLHHAHEAQLLGQRNRRMMESQFLGPDLPGMPAAQVDEGHRQQE